MKLKNIITTTLFAVVALYGVSFVQAEWIGPTNTPPDGNAPAPINVSASEQTKSGLLNLEGGLVTSGNVGRGQTGTISHYAMEISDGGLYVSGNKSGESGIWTPVITSFTAIINNANLAFQDGDYVVVGSASDPNDGTANGGQKLVLDVDGATGSEYYCDSNGENCFTATDVTGSDDVVVNLGSNSFMTPLVQTSLIAYGEVGRRTGTSVQNSVKAINDPLHQAFLSEGKKYAFILATQGERSGTRQISLPGNDNEKTVISRCYNSGGYQNALNFNMSNMNKQVLNNGMISYQGTFEYSFTDSAPGYVSNDSSPWGMFSHVDGETMEYQPLLLKTADCSDRGKGSYMMYVYNYNSLKNVMDNIYQATGLPEYKFNDPLSDDSSLHNSYWTE